MTEILSSLVKPAMEELGRITVVKIKHLFTYLCCFNNNIQSLRNEAQKLEDARSGLQRQVEAAENDAQVILPQVKTWLESASNKIQADKRGIDDEVPTLTNGCFGIKSRYLLSRKAVKVTGEMKQLMEESSKFNDISTPPPPPAQVPIPLGIKYHEFQSRKKIEEEITEALTGKEIRLMGICGMGGVGKTTMAKRIMNRVKEENMFEEILMVVVSQQVDMLKIQSAIAESLDLKLDKETLLARATKIRARLTGTKRILIVLDDVWEKLKLEDLGIPCGNEIHQGCTILVTSRNRDVVNKMDAQKICEMKILFETEAWSLFREKAGACVDELNLHSIATRVVRECKCLPIALITVGGALKDQTSITIWEDALQQLKSCNPEDMSDVIRDVYNPLKLSYTYLENRHAKSLFLLCSLFPEDVEISLEELTDYCVGLRVFCNLGNFSDGAVETVRKRVFTIVDKLKNRFLLLNGYNERHVRMHDVVRDVAIYIASHEAKEGIVDVKFNSLHSSSRFTSAWVSVFSEETSSLLRMHASRSTLALEDYSLFDEMKGLNVLSFEFISYNLQSREIEVLKNLRTLRLERCRLEPFSVVGELRSLENLYCHYCDGIEELPVEIGKLNKLKLLNFSGRSLKRIPPGVISNLVELEEFKMFYSFDKWELAAMAEVQERRNACLNEFENLSKLTCLEIEIGDINLVAEERCFSPNIVKYIIIIGSNRGRLITPHEKYIHLELPREINLASWVHRFLSSADVVEFGGDGSIPLDLTQAHSTKLLTFSNCSAVKEVVNSTTASIDDRSKFDVFPILEHLSLSNLSNLEELYGGTVLDQSNSLQNLQELYLDDLPALRHLCKRPNRIVSLDKLRRITIRKCNNLHNLFSFTASDGINQISTARSIDDLLCNQKVQFPMLEYLTLDEVGKLEVIWNAPITEGSNSFRNLTTLELSNLPAMTQLWKIPSVDVSLSNLSKIYIHGCHNLRSLFLSTMSMNILSQLAELDIKNCKMMEQVLLNEENEDSGNQCHSIKLPKLLKLRLDSMESLLAFGMGNETIEFPMLKEMNINSCHKLVSFLSSDEINQISPDGHKDNTFHLFCNQKVSFGSLKRICIGFHDKRNIWCHQISHGFFNQLEVLKFDNCKDIQSLFSFSIAENLVELKVLKIEKCKEMVKVIENDEEMPCEKPHNILFPSLKTLNLFYLSKLESFCNRRCDLRLPSLEFVYIVDCPLFEQFSSMGSVVAPNLKSIHMNHIASRCVRDLNSAIQELREEIRKKVGRRELIMRKEIEDEEINEEPTSSQTKVVEIDQEKDEKEDEDIKEESNEAKAS